MYSAVRLDCEGPLAAIVQQNENQRAILKMQLGAMF